MYQLFLRQMGRRCMLTSLGYLSILFCAALWAAAPGLVAVLSMWDSAYVSAAYYAAFSAPCVGHNETNRRFTSDHLVTLAVLVLVFQNWPYLHQCTDLSPNNSELFED